MTDRFEVPEPSPQAQGAAAAARMSDSDFPAYPWGPCLRAAYAVDVPRIVRQEVERALRKMQVWMADRHGTEEYIREYLTRFGPEEGEPSRAPTTVAGDKCPKCGRWFLPQAFGQPTISCCVLHPPGSCCHHFQTEIPAPTPSAPAGQMHGNLRVLGAPPSEAPDPGLEYERRVVQAMSDLAAAFGISDASREWRCRYRFERYGGENECVAAAPPSEAPADIPDVERLHSMAGRSLRPDRGPSQYVPEDQTTGRVAAARPEACRALHMDATAHLAECDLPASHGGPHSSATERLGPSCTACACATCADQRAFVQELARREVRVAPLLDKLFRLLDSAEAEAWTSPNCTLDAARRVING